MARPGSGRIFRSGRKIRANTTGGIRASGTFDLRMENTLIAEQYGPALLLDEHEGQFSFVGATVVENDDVAFLRYYGYQTSLEINDVIVAHNAGDSFEGWDEGELDAGVRYSFFWDNTGGYFPDDTTNRDDLDPMFDQAKIEDEGRYLLSSSDAILMLRSMSDSPLLGLGNPLRAGVRGEIKTVDLTGREVASAGYRERGHKR